MVGVTSANRRTKIVATVGPATWEPGRLVELIAAGADVLRLNFSHADPERQAETIDAIRGAAETVGRRGRDPRRPPRTEAADRLDAR